MSLLKVVISKLLAKPKSETAIRANLATKQAVKRVLVAHTGFEPVISALRGRRPKPLDECAVYPRFVNWLGIQDSNLASRIQSPLSYR